jgi:hypothetical protein
MSSFSNTDYSGHSCNSCALPIKPENFLPLQTQMWLQDKVIFEHLLNPTSLSLPSALQKKHARKAFSVFETVIFYSKNLSLMIKIIKINHHKNN